jgi:hypothetical protein
MALPQIAHLYFSSDVVDGAFRVRVATGDHASQSPIMFVEGALELFKDFIRFGRQGSCDRLGAKFLNPVFQSGRHCRAELPEENPIRTRMVRYSTSSRESSPLGKRDPLRFLTTRRCGS